MLLKKDELLPVHEFHHWDSTENGIACTATKPTAVHGTVLLQTNIFMRFSAFILGGARRCRSALRTPPAAT